MQYLGLGLQLKLKLYLPYGMGGQAKLGRLTSIHTINGVLYQKKKEKKQRSGQIGGNPPSGMSAHILEQVELGYKLAVQYCC